MKVNIKIQKSLVYDEVAETTSYIGAKGGEGAYEQVFTTDEDQLLLERYWVEACSAATDSLRPWLSSVSTQEPAHQRDLSNDYIVELEMPSNWDANLKDSIKGSLFSYFVNVITGKWLTIADADKAEGYVTMATGMMQDVELKLYHRKRPSRPIYNANDNANVNNNANASDGGELQPNPNL